MGFGIGIGIGIGIGSTGGAPPPPPPPPTTPLTIISSVTVLQWCRADLGVTIGTGVSAWADQSAGAKNYAQATGGKQPVLTASDATLNNQATIAFDGVSRNLDCAALVLPAPGTTPTYIRMIVKQISWTASEVLVADMTSNVMLVQQGVGSPGIRQFNGLAANNDMALAVGSWGRLEALFTGSTADFVKLIATKVTGASAGANGPGTGRRIGCTAVGSAFGNIAVAEILYCAGLPSSAERAALDSYTTAHFGAGLV